VNTPFNLPLRRDAEQVANQQVFDWHFNPGAVGFAAQRPRILIDER
jgi:hypothetical protein